MIMDDMGIPIAMEVPLSSLEGFWTRENPIVRYITRRMRKGGCTYFRKPPYAQYHGVYAPDISR